MKSIRKEWAECATCGGRCHKGSLRCSGCHFNGLKKNLINGNRVCIDCSTPVRKYLKTLRCKSCWRSWRAKLSESARQTIARRPPKMKSCSRAACKQQNPQPIENFNRDRVRLDGRCPWCRTCQLERNSDEQTQALSKFHAICRRVNPLQRARLIVGAARSRARQKGLDFNIDAVWFADKIDTGICEATGIKISLDSHPKKGCRNPFAPSIDRIDSSKGYTKDNVQMVCWVYNAAKNDYGADIVLRMAQALTKKYSLVLQ